MSLRILSVQLSSAVLVLILALCLAQTAVADDFFSREDEPAETEEDGSAASFSILGAFGVDGAEQEKKDPDDLGYGDFEDVSGTDIEKKYLDSEEVRMRQELRKPLPRRNPFGNRLDNVENSVEGLSAPSVLDTLRGEEKKKARR